MDGVQGGTISVLHSQSRTKQRSGLSLRVSEDAGLGMDWQRPTLILNILKKPTLPKVDQFKSNIKIRNNQVKKNTAKGYSIYIQ